MDMDINPGETNSTEREQLVPVLETIYIPQDTLNATVSESWAGLVAPISISGVDVSTAQVMAYCVGGMHLVGAKGGGKWGQRSTAMKGAIYPTGFFACEDGYWMYPPPSRQDPLPRAERSRRPRRHRRHCCLARPKSSCARHRLCLHRPTISPDGRQCHRLGDSHARPAQSCRLSWLPG